MSLFERMLESVNQVRPTDEQLAIARKLGLNVKPGMSQDDVSRLISEARSCAPPNKDLLARANNLGIVVTTEMSSDDVRKLIERADASGMFTQHQMAEALALGISLRDEMSYAEVATLIRQAQIRNPPLEKQLQLCEQIGLPIKPGMNLGQVERLLEYASKNPKYARKFQEHDPARLAELDRKQRQQYGDALVDRLYRWRKRLGPGHFLIEYKKGKEVFVDVAVIEFVEIKQGKRPYIEVGLALPLVVQEDNGNDYLEWGTDESLPAESFLHIKRLKSNLAASDLKDYSRLVAYGKQCARERNHSSAIPGK
jgi:hypothetical protein